MSQTLEQLDKVGAKTIALLDDFASKGVDFVQQQAPEVCEQIINRQLYTKIYCMCVWTIIALIGYTFTFLSIKTGMNSGKEHSEDWCVCACIFGTVSTLCFIVPNGIMGYDICYLMSAPKVYLIEYFSSLIRH